MRPLPGKSSAPDQPGLTRLADVPYSIVAGRSGSVVAENLAAAICGWGRWDRCAWLRIPADHGGLLPHHLAAAFEHRWGARQEGAGDGVWDRNLQKGEVVFSKRYKAIYGFAADELKDHTEAWDARVHPDIFIEHRHCHFSRAWPRRK